MEISEYKYSLQELLCLDVFSQTFNVIRSEVFCKAIIAWAEREVMSGENSEPLLIIASLGLDSTPDRYEVDKYLLMYQREQNIQNPSQYESALVWLRLQLGQLIEARSAIEVENRLKFFIHHYLDYPPRTFARITNVLSNLYWELFDEAIPVFNSRAAEMGENELLEYIKERLRPFYQILNNSDWIRLLTC